MLCFRKVHNIAQWTADCEVAFEILKSKLLSPPILAYPNFTKDFVLETDTSKHGLGAILSQCQEDNKLHPIAYASRSISAAEANYAITNLETLAVVWAITHFRYYLYGHNVTVITDHAAVKAVLGAPNLTGQHARWWSKVYGSGIRLIILSTEQGRKASMQMPCRDNQSYLHHLMMNKQRSSNCPHFQ